MNNNDIATFTDRTEHIVAAQLGKIEHELDANAKHISKLENELLSDKKGRKFLHDNLISVWYTMYLYIHDMYMFILCWSIANNW